MKVKITCTKLPDKKWKDKGPGTGIIEVTVDGEHVYEVQVNTDGDDLILWQTDKDGNTTDTVVMKLRN